MVETFARSSAHTRAGCSALHSPREPGRRSLAVIEQRSIGYVPLRERHGHAWHLWPVWFMGDAHLATLAAGTIGVAQGLNLLWAAVAIIGGSALGTFFMAFHAAQGPQLGLPQMIQSRPQFGYRGALLVWVVALVTYVGFNAVNQQLAGQTLHLLTGADPRLAFTAFSLVAVALAVVGYDWIHIAQRVLAAVLIAALLAYTIGADLTLHLQAAQFSISGFAATPFLSQFFAAAAYQLSWSIYVSDYSRYLPRDVGVRGAFWWTFSGGLIGGAWMMLVGMLAAAGSPGRELAASVRAAGDAVYPGLRRAVAAHQPARAGDHHQPQSLRRIADVAEHGGLVRRQMGRRARPHGEPGADRRRLHRYRNILVRRFRRPVRRSAGVAALPVHALDGDQPGGFLRRSARPLFGAGDLQSTRHVRALELARTGRLRRRVRCHGAVLQHRPLYRPRWHARSAARDIAMVVGLPVSAAIYLLACRSLDIAADRATAAAADVGLE